ncbi:hypothetical protein Y900_012465 [Mycolicibacterium aromaticivorans JS19b1 = JCM 16368]|uniref:Vegetative cell wall protein n=1 Tax=Mycolicibacterium aromaticivorans JS19b1 = JCM 16368 TaxID=1440774 RepID=A0A064CJ70_9MYCO|nr:DUF5631 domain-containing protein [Mycolicibacterium aromaticivorans]KDE99726.1 hypothetical protein Y900_012465 [Mycolicibacterium aromaticivorans JS19b1 = JCM 16368]
MAIFGRNTARQRLKRATRQALSAPTFDTPPDATPWVIGGLWPAELATVTLGTAAVAAHLKNDLQRIADSANERLHALRHADVPDFARRAEEVRIIETARTYAVQRVASTIRLLRSAKDDFDTDPAIPKITPEQVREVDVIPTPVVEPVEIKPEPELVRAPEPPPVDRRLESVLEFVARQEPGLRWAVGERADGTIVLVTDLAHGWIPPGVAVPAGVGLLPPARRGGRVGELLGDVVRSAVYHPGDPFGGGRTATATSLEARELPRVHDLGWKLVEATHWRDGLPRIVHTLAKAGAARTGVLDAEVDVLRVHSDTARYQLMAQYPDVDAALLSNCLLLAATEAIVLSDEVSANYHFGWFEALSAPPASQWGTAP